MSTCAEKFRHVKVSVLIANVTLEEIAALHEFLREYRKGRTPRDRI